MKRLNRKGCVANMTNLVAMVIACLIQVESSGNVNPVGDFAEKVILDIPSESCKGYRLMLRYPRAVGPLQMWEVSVDEANRLEGLAARREGRQPRTWKPVDRTSLRASVDMATVILTFHYKRGAVDPVELGGKWRNPFSVCPKFYLDRVRKELKKQGRK